MKAYSDCMEVREEFSAYLDGEMTAGEREGFEAHLAGCAECLRELDTMKRVDDKYRGLAAMTAPAGFEAGVREAVRTGRLGSEPVRRPVPRWMGPIVAMASAAAVLIVGVIVLEVRQGAEAPMRMADAPVTVSADAESLFQAAPAESPSASTPDQGPSGGGAAWNDFARAAEPAQEPLQKEAKAEGVWDSFTRASPVAADASVAGGREDTNTALADGIAGVGADDAAMRARAQVIGEPSLDAAAAPLAEEADASPATPEDAAAQAPASPEMRANVGEVVSRRILRSFMVRADGAWVESSYAGEPTTELKRGSETLNHVMRLHPGEAWDTMLNRTALQIFQLDGVWYALEGKPAEE